MTASPHRHLRRGRRDRRRPDSAPRPGPAAGAGALRAPRRLEQVEAPLPHGFAPRPSTHAILRGAQLVTTSSSSSTRAVPNVVDLLSVTLPLAKAAYARGVQHSACFRCAGAGGVLPALRRDNAGQDPGARVAPLALSRWSLATDRQRRRWRQFGRACAAGARSTERRAIPRRRSPAASEVACCGACCEFSLS